MASLDELATDVKYIREKVDDLDEKQRIANGRVTEIEKWQIKHEAEIGLIKRGFKFIVIPVFVALLIGMLKIVFQI